MDEELVLGEAFAVHVSHRDGGGFRTNTRELEARAIGQEQVGKLASENVFREPAQESCRHPEPGERSRGVERSSAGRSLLGAVPIGDHVDQRLAANDYHGGISPEPLVIIRVRAI